MVQREFTKLGVGRIYRSSGTTNEKTYKRINDMLTALAEDGGDEGVEVLRKLKDGDLTFHAVLAQYRKSLDAALDMASNSAITEEAFTKWITSHDCVSTTRSTYRSHYNTLMQRAKASHTMRDLPVLLKDYKGWCVKNDKHYRAFDLTLAVMKAWVSAVLGEDSKTYVQLRKVKAFCLKPDHRSNRLYSPRDVWEVAARLPDEIGAMVITMATHGCGPKEYLSDGVEVVQGVALHIKGQKTVNRDRYVPLVYTPAPLAERTYMRFSRLFAKASHEGMRLYDLRRSYRRWLKAALVDGTRIQMYMGHMPQNQSDEYGYYDVPVKELQEDGEKLRNYIEQQLRETPPTVSGEKVSMAPSKRKRRKTTYV